MVEFTVVLVLLIMLGTAMLETVRWQQQRHLLHVALLDAARAGSRLNLRPEPMAQALQAALRPLGRQNHRRWQLEVLQPGPAHYQRHGRRDLDLALPPPAIRHDYQAEQQSARPGEPTIFAANTLRLRLTYASEPATVLMAALLPLLAPMAGDACRRQALAAGKLALRLEITLEMQSDAARWPEVAGIPVHTRSQPCS